MFRLYRAIIEPDDGSVEPKHVALNVFLTIKLDLFDLKICIIFRNTSG